MKTKDAMYAAVGAPVVAGRKALELGLKATAMARRGFEDSTAEGRRAVDRVRSSEMVEDLTDRVDLSQRAGKLREQVEGALAAWKEGFQPEPAPKGTTKKAASTKEAASTKKAASKTKATAAKAKDEPEGKTEPKAKPEKVDVE